MPSIPELSDEQLDQFIIKFKKRYKSGDESVKKKLIHLINEKKSREANKFDDLYDDDDDEESSVELGFQPEAEPELGFHAESEPAPVKAQASAAATAAAPPPMRRAQRPQEPAAMRMRAPAGRRDDDEMPAFRDIKLSIFLAVLVVLFWLVQAFVNLGDSGLIGFILILLPFIVSSIALIGIASSGSVFLTFKEDEEPKDIGMPIRMSIAGVMAISLLGGLLLNKHAFLNNVSYVVQVDSKEVDLVKDANAVTAFFNQKSFAKLKIMLSDEPEVKISEVVDKKVDGARWTTSKNEKDETVVKVHGSYKDNTDKDISLEFKIDPDVNDVELVGIRLDDKVLSKEKVIDAFGVAVIPALEKRRQAALRVRSNSNIRKLIQGITIQTNLDIRSRYRNEWMAEKGIETLTENEAGDVRVDGVVETLGSGSQYEIFKELKGAHPWGGKYIFVGWYDYNGRKLGKKKGPFDVRVVLELYDHMNKGDGKVAIGFGDAHVEVFTPKRPIKTMNDILAILSKTGQP